MRRLPEGPRVRLARKLADRLTALEDRPGAEQVLRSAAGAIRAPRARTDLAATVDAWALADGRVPADLATTLALAAAEADRELKAGRPAQAAAWLTRGFDLATHRTLHFDDLSSPLAEDPRGFLAPLLTSRTYDRLAKLHGRRTPAAAPEPGRPQRILFVSYRNWNFLDRIVDHYGAVDGVEARRFDLADVPAGVLPLSPSQLVRSRLTLGPDPRDAAFAAHLLPHLEWADTVFVDWCQRGRGAAEPARPGPRARWWCGCTASRRSPCLPAPHRLVPGRRPGVRRARTCGTS